MTGDQVVYTADEIAARQSISTLVFEGYRPVGEGALRELAAHGLHQIELLESPEQFDMTDMRSMRVVGDALQSCGIRVAAYHCHRTTFGDVGSEEERGERVDKCKRQIDSMLELGGKLWGCHANDADAVVVASYQELARHVEGTEAAICVENFSRDGVMVEDRVAFLDQMSHPQVGMILDIGHVLDPDGANPMTLPGGPTRILELCGHRLMHLHGFKDGRDHHPPLCEGDGIQWAELFQMLHKVGYSGLFNFEPANELRSPGALSHTSQAPARLAAM